MLDYEWVQDAFTVTVAIFCRMGLDANLKKTKMIVCTPGFTKEKWGETSYKRRAEGWGETFR